MDVNTACTSFLYGLSTATAMIRTGVVRNALVLGGELHQRLHGLEQPRRLRAVRRRLRRRRARGDRSRGRPARRAARLRQRRPADAGRRRHGHALRELHAHVRRHELDLRGPGNLQAGGARHVGSLRGRAGSRGTSPRTTSTSSCRTRPTCGSSRPSRSAPACRWSGCSSTCTATATCPPRPCPWRWSRRSRKAASSRTACCCCRRSARDSPGARTSCAGATASRRKGTSDVELPPCDRTALEMVREFRRRKAAHAAATAG